MLNETFYIDGVDARSIGIYLQRPVSFSEPVPVFKADQIPGRNGRIIFDDGSYENRTATASCFSMDAKNVLQNIREINKFLFSGGRGYRRLETSDDPDYFWMAHIENGARAEQRMRHLAPFEITFDCKPQKFAKSGQNSMLVANGSVVYNDYGFDALPIISVRAKSGTIESGTISKEISNVMVGNTIFSIKSQWWSYDALDTRLKNRGLSVNQIKERLRTIGVTPREFGVALDASKGDGYAMFEYLVEFSNDGITREDVDKAMTLSTIKYAAYDWNAIFKVIKNNPANRIIKVDSEKCIAYNELCNQERNIIAPTFPVLKPGENTITWDGDIVAIEIIPRWWCL